MSFLRGSLIALMIGMFSLSVAAQESDLSVTKNGPDSADVDTNVTFNIQAINNGPDAATGVTLTDPIPAGLEFVSLAAPAEFMCTTPAAGSGGTITCTADSFASGATANFTLVLHVPAQTPPGTTFTNTVTIAGDVFDPNDENNSGVWGFTVNGATLADLSVIKSGPNSALPDSDVSFVIMMSNGGPSAAVDAKFIDTLPAGMTFVSITQNNGPTFTCSDPGVGNSGQVSCTIASFPSEASASFTLVVHLQAESAEHTNVVTVSTTTQDPNSENDTGVATVRATAADMTIAKVGPGTAVAGGPISWTLTVTNNGPDSAANAEFSDQLPAGSTFVSLTPVSGPIPTSCETPAPGTNGVVRCVFPLLVSGDSSQLTLTANTPANAANGSQISNTATTSSDEADPNTENNSSTAISTLESSADLSVTKTDSPDPVDAGTNLTYTITVTNNGPSDAQTVSLTDSIPASTTLVSFTVPAGWTRTDAVPNGSTGIVSATTPTLAAGTSSVFTLVVNVNSNSPNQISNTAAVSTATSDPNSENNSDTETTTVTSLPDLTISKTHQGNFTAGQPGTFTITVTNVGLAATNGLVTVTDTVPSPLTPTGPVGPHSGWACNIISQTLTCTRSDSLPAGASYPSITLTVNVPNPAPLSASNTATVSGGGEVNTNNNSSTDVVNIDCTQNLSQNNNTPLVISRFRQNGPGGITDEFIEIFNPSNTPHTVSSGNCTGGYGVFASAGNGTTANDVSLVCQIPNGTVIPARGYYLCTGAGYTLGNLGRNGGPEGATAEGDAAIGCSGNCTPDMPNDAGLALINVGTNTIVNTPSGFAGASLPEAAINVFDKIGFAPYGPGAPASGYPSLAGNFCEGNCLQPVGDASNLPTCSNPTELFPVVAGSPGCYGQSGQYELLRRQTIFNSATGTLHQDTNSNTADVLMVSPNPGINVGLNLSGVAGIKPVLGAAAPHDTTAPPDFPTTVLSRTPFDAGSQTGPRNTERIYSLDPNVADPANDPLGTYSIRFKYTNNAPNPVVGLRFGIDDLSTLCGPQSGNLETGTAEARNLSATPNCQNGNTFSAILKALNSTAEVVVDSTSTAQSVKGTVLEDLSVNAPSTPAPGQLSPLGGGIDNSLIINPSTSSASVGTGVNGGTGQFNTFIGTSEPGKHLRVKFKFGVVRTGRFIILVVPMGKTGLVN